MALKSTVYKIVLNVADLDRDYYGAHKLTVARHPSENDQRLAVKILAFARFACEGLEFTRGLCADDEPEIWQRGLTGEILHWIELGAPSEDRVRKGCNRARRVTVVAYGDRVAPVWWQKHRPRLQRFANLRVVFVGEEQIAAVAQQLNRTMDLQVTSDGDDLWCSIAGTTFPITFQNWQ